MQLLHSGDLIEAIHTNWKKDYTRLEWHHGYIQWLFPIRERGLNWQAQELQSHEIEVQLLSDNYTCTCTLYMTCKVCM